MTRLELIGRLMMLGETFSFNELRSVRGKDMSDELRFGALTKYGLITWHPSQNRMSDPESLKIIRYTLTPKAIEMFKQGE